MSIALGSSAVPAQSPAGVNVQGGASASGSASTAGASASGNASGRASADGSAAPGGSSAMNTAVASGSEFDATLNKSLDAGRVKAGEEVTATTTQELRSGNQVLVPRGSKLVGRVTEVRPKGAASGTAAGAASSSLGIVFDRAMLKDGREVPVAATIQALAAAESSASGAVGSEFGGAGSSAGVAGGGGGGGGITGGVGAVGSAVGGVAGSVGGTVGAVGGVAAGAGATLGKSAGAVGGLSSAGRFTSGSRGVFGMRSLDLSGAGSAQVNVITSSTGNVRLDRGTRMLLVTGDAGAAASAAGSAGATAIPAPR